MARLVDKGWLERLAKGKYLIVPLEAGPDRTWTEDAHVIAGHLDQVGKALLAGDGDLDWDRTTMYLRRFGSGAVVKRLGFLVETLKLTHPPKPRVLDEWLALRTAGISKLDPSTPREPHRIATRWRVEVNLPEEGLLRRT